MKRPKQTLDDFGVALPGVPEQATPAPVDHLEEIRTLARQLCTDISPSGAQTIGNQIMSHINSYYIEDVGRPPWTARQLRPTNRQSQSTGQNQSGYERSPDPIKDNGEP